MINGFSGFLFSPFNHRVLVLHFHIGNWMTLEIAKTNLKMTNAEAEAEDEAEDEAVKMESSVVRGKGFNEDYRWLVRSRGQNQFKFCWI